MIFQFPEFVHIPGYEILSGSIVLNIAKAIVSSVRYGYFSFACFEQIVRDVSFLNDVEQILHAFVDLCIM